MNNNLKSKVRDHIIVKMQPYMDKDTLQILDNIMVEIFGQIEMRQMETLPAKKRNGIDEKNRYLLQLFLYKKQNLAQRTLEVYMDYIKLLLTYTEKELTEITDIDIAGFLRWYTFHNKNITGKVNNNVTVNNARKFISAVFGWLRKEKYIDYNPVETVPPLPEEKKPIDFFSRTEMAKLRDACNSDRDRAIFEVLRSTGARVGEIQRINRFRINWGTGDVYIIGEKGGKHRLLYLDEESRYYLERYLKSRTDDKPDLFLESRKPYEPLQKSGIENIIKRIRDRAGITCRAYPHKFRKTLGMDLRNRGVEIGVIQEILGHSSPEVTAKYYAESTGDTLRGIRKRTA